MRRVGILCVNKVNMPARHISKQTRVGKWPNGDVVVAANVPSKAELRRILDYVADPGVAITSPSMQPILFEVQPANIPGMVCLPAWHECFLYVSGLRQQSRDHVRTSIYVW